MAVHTIFYATVGLILLATVLLDGVFANPIDQCWVGRNWAADRRTLAGCSVGFVGKMRGNAGRGMVPYKVTDPSDDPEKPKPGTLRYGATLLRGKVWITFSGDMQISLRRPLLIKDFTTVDGRGADVQIANGAGFVLYEASYVIIHGLKFHNIDPQPSGPVITPGGSMMELGSSDGDAIRLVSSKKVWIDHNELFSCHDGLLDVTRGSTDITVSNNWFHDHDKVMLLGHDDSFVADKRMRVTVAFNRFGPNVNQRMPRIRYGYVHVANNLFDGWKQYAIGGSMNPTVRSEANIYVAPLLGRKKLTSRMPDRHHGRNWNWRSINDKFENGAYFKQTGRGEARPGYSRDETFTVQSARAVRSLTKKAGALTCSTTGSCS